MFFSIFATSKYQSAKSFQVKSANASPAEDQKNNLRQQIDEIQQQIDAYKSNISDLQQQTNTLKRQISLFDSKIKAAELEIRRTNLNIVEAEEGIADKTLGMEQAEQKLTRERQLLGKYVQAVYEADQEGTLDLFLLQAASGSCHLWIRHERTSGIHAVSAV